jgi:hypothetical protein
MLYDDPCTPHLRLTPKSTSPAPDVQGQAALQIALLRLRLHQQDALLKHKTSPELDSKAHIPCKQRCRSYLHAAACNSGLPHCRQSSPAFDPKVHIPCPLHQRVAAQHFCTDGLLPLGLLLCCSPLSLCCALSSDALELGLELGLVI